MRRTTSSGDGTASCRSCDGPDLLNPSGDNYNRPISEQFETENPAQVIAKGDRRKPRAADQKASTYSTGGLVGYFAYDYIKYAEPTLRLDAEDQEKFRDVDLMLFDKMIHLITIDKRSS